MAITGVGAGRFVRMDDPIVYEIQDRTESRTGKTTYTYDCKFRNEDPSVIVKWCRRNFGERGRGWDFFMVRGNVIVEIWDDKLKVMYEMWHK